MKASRSIRFMRLRGERGASAVEMALVLPLFLMITLGTVTGGMAYNQQLQITHAAREGARRASVIPLDQYGYQDGAAWTAAVRSITITRSDGDLDPTRVAGADVCVAVVEGANTVYNPSGANAYTTHPSNPTCFDDGGADGELRVHVMGQRPGHIDALFWRMNLTLTTKAVGKYEQP